MCLECFISWEQTQFSYASHPSFALDLTSDPWSPLCLTVTDGETLSPAKTHCHCFLLFKHSHYFTAMQLTQCVFSCKEKWGLNLFCTCLQEDNIDPFLVFLMWATVEDRISALNSKAPDCRSHTDTAWPFLCVYHLQRQSKNKFTVPFSLHAWSDWAFPHFVHSIIFPQKHNSSCSSNKWK